MPKRIQRKRTKGWKMPPNTVSVTRPGPFGNPFRASDYLGDSRSGKNRKMAVDAFRTWIEYDDQVALRERIRTELRGKDLACFCAICEQCHADVLLELANREVSK